MHYDLSIFRGKPELSRGNFTFLWVYSTLLGALLLVVPTFYHIPFGDVTNLVGTKSWSSCDMTLTETSNGHWPWSRELAAQVNEHGFWCPKSWLKFDCSTSVCMTLLYVGFLTCQMGIIDLNHLMELLWKLFENLMWNAQSKDAEKSVLFIISESTNHNSCIFTQKVDTKG